MSHYSIKGTVSFKKEGWRSSSGGGGADPAVLTQHTDKHRQIHTHTHMYIHTHTRTYTHTCTYIHTYTHMYIHTCTYIHTHTHTYIYKHTYIYTHAQMIRYVDSLSFPLIPSREGRQRQEHFCEFKASLIT